MTLWEALRLTTRYQYRSQPGEKSVMGWAGKGQGKVNVSEEQDTLYFYEKGSFTLEQNGNQVSTQNEYIWKRISEDRIKLLHSRFGRDNTVELFDLIFDDASGKWKSETAHHCGDDLYSGHISIIDNEIQFNWSIIGPRKQENLYYCYTR